MKIAVYDGPGVSEESFARSYERFEACGVVTPTDVRRGVLSYDGIVMPGGADRFYDSELCGIGNANLRKFVEQGGTYFGICAGGYYGGSFVDFAKGTLIEVQEERELGFFPGSVRGPHLAPYEYGSESGALDVLVTWEGGSELVYYNGGGYFVGANRGVLATYPDGKAAIVSCSVGKGKAILSGVHYEYYPCSKLFSYLLASMHRERRCLSSKVLS